MKWAIEDPTYLFYSLALARLACLTALCTCVPDAAQCSPCQSHLGSPAATIIVNWSMVEGLGSRLAALVALAQNATSMASPHSVPHHDSNGPTWHTLPRVYQARCECMPTPHTRMVYTCNLPAGYGCHRGRGELQAGPRPSGGAEGCHEMTGLLGVAPFYSPSTAVSDYDYSEHTRTAVS
eukprot:CAMPEP_0174709290 /NCGR_PEP_ID=MMETSP1094-20130205/11300_1 /TAXON_ID=156173 /ORGANISM="Chrysochromulina brevifilum, Strain UTEX LB 985" /LENGTH=179 /DNA_ID=CAMNT_0015907953 /DNA_START=216 /DNA_END=757 /DNA_ORIENTATION=-